MDDTSTRNVLFVDDTPEDANLYADYFDRDPTINPITALSAEEGLTKLDETEINCVVSDSVHTSDGEPLVAVAKDKYPDIPVLLHSGRRADTVPTDVADAYLQKGTRNDDRGALELLGEHVHGLVDSPGQTAPRTISSTDGGWHSLGTVDWTSEEETTVAVIEAIAEMTDVDPVELAPLHDTINTEALAAVMRHAAADKRTNPVSVQFELAGFTVRVHSNGSLSYRDGPNR